MMKRIMLVVLTIGVTLGLSGQVDVVNASVPTYDNPGECSITIDGNKHTGATGNGKYAQGNCGLVEVYGHFHEPSGQYGISNPTTTVKDGDTFLIGSAGRGYYNLTVHVIPKKAEPKPSPKSQPKPKPKPQPKPQPKPEPKPQPKPKQNSSSSTNSTNKGSNSSPKNNSQPSSSSSNEQTTDLAQKSESKDTEKEKKKDNKKKKKQKKKNTKLTVKELQEKEAEVMEKDGTLYAVYKNKDDKEVKQKLTEDEAKELGYEEKEEEIEEVEKTVIDTDETKAKSSNIGWIIGLILLLLVFVGGGGYYYYKRKVA